MQDIFRLDIPFEPVPAARPKVSRFGTYYPTKYKNFKKDIDPVIRERWAYDAIDFPINVQVLVICQRPKTTKLPFPKGDWDNFGKAVTDAMNGIVYTDDWLIQDGRTAKAWAEPGEPGRIMVFIERAPHGQRLKLPLQDIV